jgi:NADH-quinone oxidoreductase subunit C
LSSAETEAPAAEAAPTAGPDARDELRSPLIDTLRAKLGDGVVTQHVNPGVDAWVRVTREAWAQAAEVCRDDLGLAFFDFLSAIDWLPLVHGKNEEPPTNALVIPATSAELQHGVTGGETRFQLIARLVSPTQHVGLHLRCDLPDDDTTAPTWSSIYLGANWHERETWEMYGITFTGHPQLEHIYLPGGFEGFPMRKDFPLLARHVKPWPGLVDVEAMPGEPDEDDATTTEGADA